VTTVVVLAGDSTPAHRSEVIGRAEAAGATVIAHTDTMVVLTGDQRRAAGVLGALPQVVNVASVAADYPLAAVESRCGNPSVVRIGGCPFGPFGFAVIAGPCVVETRDQLVTIADAVRAAGCHVLRGGAFKPRTSPYSFQGLGLPGLELMAEARERTGLPFVTEILDVRAADQMAAVADALQIGARNMQNYPLLREVGRLRRPVVLKRGPAATIEETLLAAEYILANGNEQVIICERGIRTFERGYRYTLDLTAVTVFRERTHLPVIVDPSHAAGATRRVVPLALAAAAAGADGIMVEVHHDPANARCDGQQALTTGDLSELMSRLRLAAAAAGRALHLAREPGDRAGSAPATGTLLGHQV